MPTVPTEKQTSITERDIVYQKVEAIIFEESGGLFDDESARHLLGWTEPDEGQSFDIYHLKDIHKRTIFCSNISLQRPITTSLVYDLMWEMLAGNWKFNLETIIVGETGVVLDGQHRLIALVLANQEYHRNPERYPHWKTPPALEMIVAVGAKETPEVANTIGTGKPRSLADSFYASGLFDKNEDAKHMKQLCRMAEHTMRLLWTRTGAKGMSYNAKFSHMDALDFIMRHPGVLGCIRVIHEENNGSERRIDKISGAYAAGLLYLMKVSATDPDSYRRCDTPSELYLEFERDEIAEEYWLLLGSKDSNVAPVVDAIQELTEQGNFRADERIAILVKGWNAYVKNRKVEREDVLIRVDTNEDGIRHLLEDPTVGGVDLGFSTPV